MVGRFGLGRKSSPARESRISDLSSPPPPYKANGSVTPIILAETTTTTTEVVTTTTQTTTHFFSLPLWRRLGHPASPTTRRSTSGLGPDENGMIRPNSTSIALMLEKDLPPTPPDDSDPSIVDEGRSERDEGASQSRREKADTLPELNLAPQQSFPPSDSRKVSKHVPPIPSPHSQPTLALAHAALGLGLPHVMPQASPSSSSAEVNTVAFMTAPVPNQGRRNISGIRRAKSTQKVNEQSSSEQAGVTAERRARGLSVVTGPLLQLGNESEPGKGKAKEIDDNYKTQPSPKTVSRRSSFWTRRKNGPSSETATRSSQVIAEALPVPSLPTVQPVSPFNLDLRTSSPTPLDHDVASQHSRSLSRSHSERARSQRRPKTASGDVKPAEGLPKAPARNRTSQRPSTADAYARSRARSFFFDSTQPEASSPQPSTLSHTQETFPESRPSERQSQAVRPRAQTNPPLLHRLSANLFSSPASNHTTNVPENYITRSPAVSSTDSQRPSLSKHAAEIPKPQTDEESPEVYLKRLLAAVSKAEVAAVLASR